MTEASAGEQRPPGFLERLRASTGGVIAGACLFALSLYVLFTNEGRALRIAAALDEGLSQLVCVQSDAQPELRNDGRLVHLSGDLRTAQVGDVRVRFAYAGLSGDGLYPGSAHKVSVVAQQHQQQLRPFSSRSGHTLELLYMGQLTAEELFAKEHQLNSMKTWALRLAGCTLMFLSISLSTRVIHTLVERVPLLGGLLSVGLQLFCLCSSISLSLLTIAAGWIYYRPLLALCVAAAALVLPLALAHARAPAKKRQ
ncbi:transmembrane protein 43 isoform X2 [Danio rerio]|uniref:Transmembrane protein 43 isoform X2 n=1 Tax=Danio rerio TaxID=7955 RepID=A0AC58IE44_DANRE